MTAKLAASSENSDRNNNSTLEASSSANRLVVRKPSATKKPSKLGAPLLTTVGVTKDGRRVSFFYSTPLIGTTDLLTLYFITC